MRSRPARWTFGVPALLAGWAFAAWEFTPAIERAIRDGIDAPRTALDRPALDRLGVRLDVRGRDVTILADDPLPDGLGDGTLAAARAVPGVRRVAVRIEPPVLASPFRFEVARNREGLRLSGVAPPGAARAALVDRARAAPGGRPVEDDLRSALGAPTGFAACADLLVEAVHRLTDGRAILVDGRFTIDGEAPDSATYRSVAMRLSALPAGCSLDRSDILPPLAAPYRWSATREGSRIAFDGYVPSEPARAAVLAAAGASLSGLEVDDRMETARGLDGAVEFAQLLRVGVAALSRLVSGRVALDGRSLSVEGATPARDMLPTFEAEIRRAASGLGLERLALRAVPAIPYVFGARRTDGKLALRGYVPADTDRLRLGEVASRRFPFEALQSDLHLADGAPDRLAAVAQAGLEALSVLSDGEVAITDRHLRVTASGLYQGLVDRARRDLAAAVPPGWSVALDVAFVPAEKPLDAGACEDLLAESLQRAAIRFPAETSDVPEAGSAPLAQAADILRRCGASPFRIVARIDGKPGGEAALQLAQRRAEAVAAALARRGVVQPLVADVAGRGANQPDGSGQIAIEAVR